MNYLFSIELPNIVTIIVISFMLGLNTYLDIKKQELSLWSILASVIIVVVCNLIFNNGIPIVNMLLGAALCFVPFFISTLAGKSGGGDLLITTAVGLCIGLYSCVYVLLLTMLVCWIFMGVKIIRDRDNEEMSAKAIATTKFAFVPFLAVGWILYIIVALIF